MWPFSFIPFSKDWIYLEARGTAQQLGHFAAFGEDLNSITNIHNCLYLQFQGNQCPPVECAGTRHVCGINTYSKQVNICTTKTVKLKVFYMNKDLLFKNRVT